MQRQEEVAWLGEAWRQAQGRLGVFTASVGKDVTRVGGVGVLFRDSPGMEVWRGLRGVAGSFSPVWLQAGDECGFREQKTEEGPGGAPP